MPLIIYFVIRYFLSKFATKQIVMQSVYQYFYHQGKVGGKLLLYITISGILIGLGVFCFTRWDLTFMFTEWRGYVLLVPYFLITLGNVLSIFIAIGKIRKTIKQIPALAVGNDHFIVFDNNGLSTEIPFEDCDKVKFKSNYYFRGGLITHTLIVKYHTKADPDSKASFEVNLSELNLPQHKVEKELKTVFNQYVNMLESQQ